MKVSMVRKKTLELHLALSLREQESKSTGKGNNDQNIIECAQSLKKLPQNKDMVCSKQILFLVKFFQKSLINWPSK